MRFSRTRVVMAFTAVMVVVWAGVASGTNGDPIKAGQITQATAQTILHSTQSTGTGLQVTLDGTSTAAALKGLNNGAGNGISGFTSAPNAYGNISGNTAASHGTGAAGQFQGGQNDGVRGYTANGSSFAVKGVNTAGGKALAGFSNSAGGTGLYGEATGSGGLAGDFNGDVNVGGSLSISGSASLASSDGLVQVANSGDSNGLRVTANSDFGAGVDATNQGQQGAGVIGRNFIGGAGSMGVDGESSAGVGVRGLSIGTGPGVEGQSAAGWGGEFDSAHVTGRAQVDGHAHFLGQVDVDGALGANQINSPKWSIAPVSLCGGGTCGTTHNGPLPLSGSFSSNGGTLVVTVAGTAYATNPGALQPPIVCLAVSIDSGSAQYSCIYGNEVEHLSIPPYPMIFSGLSAGSHTLHIDYGSTSPQVMLTDGFDTFHAVVEELPF